MRREIQGCGMSARSMQAVSSPAAAPSALVRAAAAAAEAPSVPRARARVLRAGVLGLHVVAHPRIIDAHPYEGLRLALRLDAVARRGRPHFCSRPPSLTPSSSTRRPPGSEAGNTTWSSIGSRVLGAGLLLALLSRRLLRSSALGPGGGGSSAPMEALRAQAQPVPLPPLDDELHHHRRVHAMARSRRAWTAPSAARRCSERVAADEDHGRQKRLDVLQ